MEGKKIDDHSWWGGGKSKGSVFPEGVKTKDESSAEGSGSVMRYEDTTESIKSQQQESVKKCKDYPMKPGFRN
jgi:hypothetical protein